MCVGVVGVRMVRRNGKGGGGEPHGQSQLWGTTVDL